MEFRRETMGRERAVAVNLNAEALQKSRALTRSQEQLKDYAFGLSEKKEVMSYLKLHNPEFSQKIQDLSKSHELHRERGFEKELERGERSL